MHEQPFGLSSLESCMLWSLCCLSCLYMSSLPSWHLCCLSYLYMSSLSSWYISSHGVSATTQLILCNLTNWHLLKPLLPFPSRVSAWQPPESLRLKVAVTPNHELHNILARAKNGFTSHFYYHFEEQALLSLLVKNVSKQTNLWVVVSWEGKAPQFHNARWKTTSVVEFVDWWALSVQGRHGLDCSRFCGLATAS